MSFEHLREEEGESKTSIQCDPLYCNYRLRETIKLI